MCAKHYIHMYVYCKASLAIHDSARMRCEDESWIGHLLGDPRPGLTPPVRTRRGSAFSFLDRSKKRMSRLAQKKKKEYLNNIELLKSVFFWAILVFQSPNNWIECDRCAISVGNIITILVKPEFVFVEFEASRFGLFLIVFLFLKRNKENLDETPSTARIWTKCFKRGFIIGKLKFE